MGTEEWIQVFKQVGRWYSPPYFQNMECFRSETGDEVFVARKTKLEKDTAKSEVQKRCEKIRGVRLELRW